MPRDEEFELLDVSAPKHVTLTAHQQSQRMMIIGDVHGCCDELRELIREHGRVGDLIIFVGDIVNKGPKSVEVVQLARQLNALAVIGNHELASLRGYHLRKKNPAKESAYGWTDEMTIEDVSYISRLPYTISIPNHDAIVVHAGLVPEVALPKQKPRDMVAMRNVANLDGHWKAFEAGNEGKAWATEWQGPTHVYFGHDAKRRLQREAFATGLDTGCLYGGALTAALLNPDGTKNIVSVKSHATYVNAAEATPRAAPAIHISPVARTIPAVPIVPAARTIPPIPQRNALVPVAMCAFIVATACLIKWKHYRSHAQSTQS
jgi:hypothetical protein